MGSELITFSKASDLLNESIYVVREQLELVQQRIDIVINDTNIFLDLYDAGLLDVFFQLPVQVHTVDFVINEITRPEQQKVIQPLIDRGILVVKDYPSTNIPNLYQFNQECGGNLTLTDSTVIYYAKSLADLKT